MPNLMQNTVTFETVAHSPSADTTDTYLSLPAVSPVQTRTAAPWLRTLARQWETAAVIALMLACAAYGVYALLFLTGF